MKLIVICSLMEVETKNINVTSFVTISKEASDQVKSVIAAQKQEGLFLRIFVQGGCGGVSYGMAVDMRRQEDDIEFMVDGLKVVVDRISEPYVQGATVEFDTTGEKKGFRISNPNAADLLSQSGGCCGSSTDASSGCGGGSCGSGGGCC